MPDGTRDLSTIYGQPPIVAGTYSDIDLDPERNVATALSHFNFHRDRVRSFTRKATGIYSLPEGMEYSKDAAQLVIDAYKSNSLAGLNLPYVKEPDQLNSDERFQLLGLGHKVIETSLVSKYGLKSFEDYSHYEICKQNLENIGKAYNVVENSSALLSLENVPNLKALYLDQKLDFEDVFKLRYLSSAKYFRKWINNVGESENIQEVTTEYLKEIKDNTKFFGTGVGKFVRCIGMLAIGNGLGALVATTGAGLALSTGLSFLDNFWLDSLLKGKNPSIFIDQIKDKIWENENS